MKTILLFILTLFSLFAKTQTVSGLYSGTLYNDTTKLLQNYQLALSEYKGKITGYSYTTFVINDTFYYGIRSIKAMLKDDKLIVEEDKMLVNNFPEAPAKGVRRLTVIPLTNQKDTLSSLSGRWETNRTKKWLPVTGSIKVNRDNDSTNSALIGHLKELGLMGAKNQTVAVAVKETKIQVRIEPIKKAPPTLAVAALPHYLQRKTKLLETLTCISDSLVFSFYDNGVADGDVISVYVNDEQIVSSLRLLESALKKTVHFHSKGTLEVKLVAENMGSIPPNTGLLVVQDGNTKYNLNFSADLQTNASIILRKKN